MKKNNKKKKRKKKSKYVACIRNSPGRKRRGEAKQNKNKSLLRKISFYSLASRYFSFREKVPLRFIPTNFLENLKKFLNLKNSLRFLTFLRLKAKKRKFTKKENLTNKNTLKLKKIEFPIFFSLIGWQPRLALILKRIRKDPLWPFKNNWQEIISLVLLFVLIFNTLFWQKPKPIFGATYIWTQTDWSGGATTTFAQHPQNQTGWNRFFSEENINFSVSGQLTLSKINSWKQTSATDFSGGTFNSTKILGDGEEASIVLDLALPPTPQPPQPTLQPSFSLPTPLTPEPCSGTDHQGADWTPTTTISGDHCNVGTFIVATGTTISVNQKTRIFAQNAIINGTLTSNFSGYPAQQGPGAGGYGYWKGSGAGYGGVGGPGDNPGGQQYGSTTAPTDLGSGGGNADRGYGGSGGGAIFLKVQNNLILNGTISSNGGGGAGRGGGGSGGSIWLITNNFQGSGGIFANGGNGGEWAGGGGGGRIAVYFQTIDFTGLISADGGFPNGRAGSIYLYDKSLSKVIFYHQGGTSSVAGTQAFFQATTTNSKITVESIIGSLVYIDIPDFEIPSNKTFSVNAGGYVAQQGPGAGGYGYWGGSGAGYGGVGGPGNNVGGGSTYGSTTAPTDLGSGGGNADYGYGGSGGGAIFLKVQNNLILNGTISSNGAQGGGDYGGGGSGGSVWLITNNFQGSGQITANGGNRGIYAGGGGGGGRIAVYYKDNSGWSGSLSVNGGWPGGQAGTIYFQSLLGTFISSTKDFGIFNTEFLEIVWNATTNPPTTSIKFQIATNNDNLNWEFLGPDGSTSTFYTLSGSKIWSGHNGKRYLKYKVFLDTTDFSQTPALHSVIINLKTEGEIVSSPYNAGDPANVLAKISWAENLPPDTEIEFQIRTSPNNLTWTDWCGPDDPDNSTTTCSTSTWFSDPTGNEKMDEMFGDGLNDQWIQYKIKLSSKGLESPTLFDVTLTYVVNAPPEFNSNYPSPGAGGVLVFQGSDNKVNISYSIRDIDTTAGTFTKNYITPLFQYSLDGGINWNFVSTSTITFASPPSQGDVKDINSDGWIDNKVLEDNYLTYTAFWDAKSQLGQVYNTQVKIKVIINDNEATNNLAFQISPPFVLDTKDPIVGTPSGGGTGININQNFLSPLGNDKTATTSVTLYLSVTDDSSLQMSLSNDGIFDTETYEGYASQKSWNLLPGDGQKTVSVKFKDQYGNEIGPFSDTITLDTTPPSTPTNMYIQEVSDPSISLYRLFISWQKNNEPDFLKYEVWRSTDGTNFNLLSTISDININYFADSGLSTSTVYYYQVKTLDDVLNSSSFSSIVSAQPGVSQPTDLIAPTISNVAFSEVGISSAKISWNTNEISTTQVIYSTDPQIPQGSPSQGVSGYTSSHLVILVGLNASTTYYFKVKSCDPANNCREFPLTPPYPSFTTLAQETEAPIISNIQVSEISESGAKITWQTNEPSTSFVEYSTTPGFFQGNVQGKFEYLTNHSVNLIGLSASTTYYFRVRSTDSVGNETISSENSFTTLPSTQDITPPQISNVATSFVSYNTATITWLTNEPSSSFVEFGQTTSFGRIYGKKDRVTSHSVELPKDLFPSTLYHFRVRSVDSAGNEAISESYTFTTTPSPNDTTPPIISNVQIGSADTTSITITWQTNEDADSFVEYSANSPLYNLSQGSPSMKTTHSVTLVGLRPSTLYYFRIKSADSLGNVARDDNSGQGYIFVTAQAEGSIPEIIESSISISDITHNSAKISWQTDINSNSFVEYGFDTSYGFSQGQFDLVRNHSVILQGLLSNATYYFRVRSANNFGEAVSQNYTFVTKSTPDLTPPLIFNVTTTNITLNSATISWQTDERADSLVNYGTSTAKLNLVAGTTATSTVFHQVLLENLNPGTTYYFYVSSKDSAGNVAINDNSGNYFSFQTLPDITPPVISEVRVPVIDLNSATITWKTNEPTTSKVEYATSSDLSNSSFTEEITDPRMEHSVIISNLLSGTRYYYRVISRDLSGNLATSSISFFVTKSIEKDTTPPQISNVSVSNITLNSATISWQTNENSISLVDYGKTTSLGQLAGNVDQFTTSHLVILNNLEPNTTYYFQVRSQDSAGNSAIDNNQGNYYTFTTLKDTQAPVISQVKVTNISHEKATITWLTDKPSTSQVIYGTSLNYGLQTPEDSTLTIQHSVTLTNLTSKTTYYFKVISKDAFGNSSQDDNQGQGYSFTTLEKPGETIIIERGGFLPPGLKTEKEWCQKMGLYWYDNACHKEPKEKDRIKEVITKAEEIGVAAVIEKASKAFIEKILEALPKNPFVKEISEETLITSIEEITPRVISPPQISGEFPQVEVGADYAKITWVTDKKSNSIVALAEAKDYDPTKEEPYTMIEGNIDELVTFHQVLVTGLKPDTLYHYQVRSKAQLGDWAKSEDRTFKTLSRLPEISEVKFIEITENSVKISWQTSLPTKSKVEITDTKTGEKIIQEDLSYLKEHLMTISNLKSATNYSLQIFAEDEQKNTSFSPILPFSTTISKEPPIISQVRVSTALIPGKIERVQAIISWKTNKPATSRVYYEEGITLKKELPLSTPLDSNLTLDHIVITTAFKPGKIYRFRVESIDAFGNKSYSQDFTILTPRPKESVIDLIIQNFEETFGFLKRLRF